jgi:hypothetical protein
MANMIGMIIPGTIVPIPIELMDFLPINSTSSPTRRSGMSVQELKALARSHWAEHLPNKVKALKESGELEEELHGAASLAQAEIEHLMRNQGYLEHEAREVALANHILIKPGPADAPEDEQDRELAELEREYQENPPVLSDRMVERIRNGEE